MNEDNRKRPEDHPIEVAILLILLAVSLGVVLVGLVGQIAKC